MVGGNGGRLVGEGSSGGREVGEESRTLPIAKSTSSADPNTSSPSPVPKSVEDDRLRLFIAPCWSSSLASRALILDSAAIGSTKLEKGVVAGLAVVGWAPATVGVVVGATGMERIEGRSRAAEATSVPPNEAERIESGGFCSAIF